MEEQEDESSPEGQSAYIWKYFTVSSSNAQTGGSKHIVCMFCRKNFSSCSTTRASAHILGRPVMGQQKAGIHPCLAIQKKDDDRRAVLRSAQKELGEVICGKEMELNGKKRQEVMESLMSPKKQSSDPDLKSRKKSGSKSLDVKIAPFFYEKAQKDWHCAYKERTGFLQLDSTLENARTMSP